LVLRCSRVGLCIAEVADIRRLKTKDAFACHNGTTPLAVWSGNHDRRYRPDGKVGVA
jgi:transposase IS116/IS110/IS902 family protein